MKKHQVLLLLFSILNVATLKAKVEIASILTTTWSCNSKWMSTSGHSFTQQESNHPTYLDFYCLLYHIRQEWKVENKNFHP